MIVPVQRRDPEAVPPVREARAYLGGLDGLDLLARGDAVDRDTLLVLVAAAYSARQRFAAALLDHGFAALPAFAAGVEVTSEGRDTVTLQVVHDWLWRVAVAVAGREDPVESEAAETEGHHV